MRGIWLVAHKSLYQLVNGSIIVTPVRQASSLSLCAKPHVDDMAGQMANAMTLLERHLTSDTDKEIMSKAASFDRESSQFPAEPLITNVNNGVWWIAALLDSMEKIRSGGEPGIHAGALQMQQFELPLIGLV